MGVVYCAHDSRLLRDVALKVLSSRTQTPESRKRFLREAQTASALNHPGIVTIHDIGEHDGEIYIVMEYIKGQPLRDLIPSGGMGHATAIEQAMQIADALAAAHAAGIVHRDLKPSNLIVTPQGRVKILDFGLARYNARPDPASATQSAIENAETRSNLTAAHTFLGTVAYASPEQSMGHPVDHRSDIFSAAIVLHEMLTGERPFEGASTMDLIFEINRGAPKRLRESRPDLPWSLEALLLRMLEKKPDDRIQSMEMVRASLGAIDREIQHREAETRDGNSPAAAAPETREPHRDAVGGEIGVAVLRFRAVPQNAEAEAFSDGLAEETIQALGGIPRIRVASRIAAARFEDGKSSMDVLSRALKANYVLTGTVRHSGTRVRVLSELADTGNGSRLWSRTYDSGNTDPFDAQEEIARSIAAAVSGALLTIDASGNVSGETLDAPALVRRAHRAVFAAYSRAGIEEATGLLRQAMAVAPYYAPAYAYLGLYLQQLVISGFSLDPERDRAEALGSVERALQLAPGDAEVLQNAGLVFASQFQAQRAIGVLRRAVEIAEFNLVAWGYLAFALGWTGSDNDMAEAQAIFDRLIRETPDHPSMPYWLYFKAGVCFRQGKYDEALDCTRRCVERQPQFLVGLMSYANALGLTGRLDEAREVIGRVLALSPHASEQHYIHELIQVVSTVDLVRPHIAGLVAAGIFKGVQ